MSKTTRKGGSKTPVPRYLFAQVSDSEADSVFNMSFIQHWVKLRS
jgi:hypothetical protein